MNENEDQYKLLSSFHDGYLEGILLRQNSGARLICRMVSGELWHLDMKGVTALKADNFQEGNIIFTIRSYSEQECPDNLLFLRDFRMIVEVEMACYSLNRAHLCLL